MTTPRRCGAVLFLVLAAMLWPAAGSLASVNLVVNGGFESGNLAGWTTFGTLNPDPDVGHVTMSGPGLGGIKQEIETTPGEKYLVSFQLGNVNLCPPAWSSLRVSWGGQVLYDGGVFPMSTTSWSYEVLGGVGETTDLEFDLYKHTMHGDANLDGAVNIADLSVVLANYDKAGLTLSQGDFTGDGRVNIADLSILLANYDQSLASITNYDQFILADVIVASAIPEPATIVIWSLLGMAAAGYGLRRRRHATVCDKNIPRDERRPPD